MSNSVLNGIDLILSVGGNALGYSTGCKISTSTETGERVTKEASAGKWKEKYVKSFSETISADGVVRTDGTTDMPTYDQLKAMQMAGEPVEASYSVGMPEDARERIRAATRAATSLRVWNWTDRPGMTRNTRCSWRTAAP